MEKLTEGPRMHLRDKIVEFENLRAYKCKLNQTLGDQKCSFTLSFKLLGGEVNSRLLHLEHNAIVLDM